MLKGKAGKEVENTLGENFAVSRQAKGDLMEVTFECRLDGG